MRKNHKKKAERKQKKKKYYKWNKTARFNVAKSILRH